MDRELYMPKDADGQALQTVRLHESVDLDGTDVMALSDALECHAVRIAAITELRFMVGEAPVATATSHYLAAGADYCHPVNPGEKVAIFGGKANIGVAGM